MPERWLEAARSGEMQRQMVDELPLPVMIHDGERIVYVNKACTRLAGAVDASEIIGLPLFDFVHPAALDTAKEQVRLTYERDLVVTQLRLRLVGFNGADVRCSVAAFPVHILGRDLVATVITEHERANHNPAPTS